MRSDATRSSLYSTLSCSLTVKSRTPFSLFVGFANIPWRPVQRADRPRPRHGLLSRFWRPPADRGPTSPVGMVRRQPWSVAIATCPTTISSPRSPRGLNASEGVDRVSFCVAMLRIRRWTSQCSCNGEWRKWSLGSLGLNYHLQTSRTT